MNCRVCGAAGARNLGVAEYLAGYAWTVYDCAACGCRFTRHDDGVYDRLHASGAIDYYAGYRKMLAQTKELFDRKDAEGLRRFLAGVTKYRFIMDATDAVPAGARMLEVGCSRGYLTSHFILGGRDVLGVDVSADAVASATAAFGQHFASADATRVGQEAPYDVVYHVGMIGCVADPIGLTRKLLALLKPGGVLLFNAPNKAARRSPGQLWFDSAPPPDLVTLFPPRFWQQRFSDAAEVHEEVECCDADQSLGISLRKLGLGGWLERGVAKLGRVSRLAALAPRQPSEFGLLVTMRAKGASR